MNELRRPAPPRPGRSPLIAAIVLAVILVAVATFFLWYRGIGRASPSLPTASSCATGGCHSSKLKGSSQVYLFAQGQPVEGAEPVVVAAGDGFELSAYFSNLLGDPARHRNVGVEIVVPEEPPWSVQRGTGAPAGGPVTGAQGLGAWNAAWDRSEGKKWLLSTETARRYYLGTAGTDPGPKGENTGVDDRGDSQDPDGVANNFGTDAFIAVSAKTKPGLYKVAVYGIGFKTSGDPAYLAATVNVAVTAPPNPQTSGSSGGALEARASGETVYRRSCAGCHGAVPLGSLLGALGAGRDQVRQELQSRDDHQKLVAAGEMEPLLDYLMLRQAMGPITGAAPVAHPVEGRGNCLSCHAFGTMAPYPSNHGNDTACLNCHRALPSTVIGAPAIPHQAGSEIQCRNCHTDGGAAVALPVDHASRGEDTCRACHDQGPLPPPATHTLEGRLRCLTCHGADSNLALPADHAGRRASTCLFCHSPRA